MTRDDGMHRDRRARAEHARAVMGRRQALEIFLHPVRQRVVGRIHAGEHGVAAAVRRDRVVVEHAAERRDRRAGLVAVEVLAGNLLGGLVVVELADGRIVGSLADRRLADMLAERTEIAGEADLILEADLLIAEEDHQIAREGIVQLLDLLVGERPGEIDLSDLGADMRARGVAVIVRNSPAGVDAIFAI